MDCIGFRCDLADQGNTVVDRSNLEVVRTLALYSLAQEPWWQHGSNRSDRCVVASHTVSSAALLR